jgi:hypothetical protein
MSRVIALMHHMLPAQRTAVRTRVAAVVEQLTTVLDEMLTALDQLDGDAEIEEGGDKEPELGWTGAEGAYGVRGNGSAFADEPSLGWTTTFNQASRHRLGDAYDYEQDDADKEPSLGSIEQLCDQTRWGASRTVDLEEQCEGGGEGEGL